MAKNYTMTMKLLALVSYLESRPRASAPIGQACRDLGLNSVAELRDLVTTLAGVHWDTGDPLDSLRIDISDEDDGDISLCDSKHLGFVFTPDSDDTFALTLALQMLAQGMDAEELSVVESAMVKLARVANLDAPAPAPEFLQAPAQDRLGVVRQAIAAGRCVDIVYRNDSGEVSLRRIQPVDMVTEDGRWYLDAWCLKAEEWRRFRVDRLIEATATDVTVEVPQRAKRRRRREKILVTVVPSARYLVDEPEVDTHRTDEEGRPVLVLKAYTRDWAVRYICSLGSAVVAVEPAEVAQAVRERAGHALAPGRLDV